MNEPAAWIENNERHLGTMLAWLCLSLEATSQAGERDSPADQANLARLRQEMLELEQLARPPALTLLSRALGLSEFECRVLALCAAMELDTRIPNLCAAAQRDDARPYPSFALAFALWPDAQWNAVSPHGALRYWRLLEISQPNALPLTAAALALDERILNYLKGVNYLDDRLTPLLDPVAPGADGANLTRSQQQAVERIVSGLGQCNQAGPTPVVELSGHDGASMRLVASSAAAALGLNLQVLHVSMLPAGNGDQETFARLWQRESLLMPLALYVETAGATEVERSRLARFLRRSNGVVFIEGSSGDIGNARGRITLPIGKPVPAEQAQLWASALPDGQAELAQLLSEQFSFNAEEITRLVTAAEIMDDAGGRESALWQACRGQSRTGLNQLAQRIDARARWDELVLPPEQKSLLRAITDQVGQRSRVYRDWGFGQRLNRGLGINALFSGESGTGKSMAAEVIANELELDLYRIDLSAVVNKYIGETEKNLRKLFDAAEESGAILFFD